MWLRALVGVAALLLVVLAAALLLPVVRDPRAARRRLESLLQAPGADTGSATRGPLLQPLLVVSLMATPPAVRAAERTAGPGVNSRSW